jgi:RNA polymerase sigma-70 factor (TIGR02943 family)
MNMTVEQTKELKTIFSEWVHLYSDKLYSWAFYKTSNKEVAEDLVQETFLSAYQALDHFEGKSNPNTWLTAILNNKIIDHYRKSAKNFIQLNNEESKSAYIHSEKQFDEKDAWVDKQSSFDNRTADVLLNDAAFVAALEKCYESLPPNWKKAVQARYILDVDSSQICQELDITPSNYWKVIQRAKLSLKQCLEINWFK